MNIHSGELKSFEPYISSLGIEIEAKNFPVTAPTIDAHVKTANNTLARVFGREFYPGYIRKIVTGVKGKSDDHGGTWDPTKRELLIYSQGVRAISSSLGTTVFAWKPILDHELGHAFHSLNKSDDKPTNKVAAEATAWLMAAIIGTQGNQQKIIDILARVSSPDHTLFNYDLLRYYPELSIAAKDAPLLYFILQKYGFYPMLDVVNALPFNEERSPKSQDEKSIIGKGIEDIRRETKQQLDSAEKRHLQFQNKVKKRLGVTLRKLSLDSHSWYRENAKTNPIAPPTLGERLRHIKEVLPFTGGKLKYPPITAKESL